MEDDRLLERERIRMEQIRELDSEELQVEEVGDESSSDDDHSQQRRSGRASASGEFTYDTSLAALHSYLGDVEDTHNRLAFLEGGAILNLPLFYLEGVVLFPEATLPLRVVQPNFIAAIEQAVRQVEAPYTIGVVHFCRDPRNGRIKFATTGTTAEIRKYQRLEDGSVNVVTRGQQRFRLRRSWMDVEGTPCGEIQVIQEDLPLRMPREAVGSLAPPWQLRSGGLLPRLTPESSCANNFGSSTEDDSDSMSEESIQSELSLRERRLCRYALISSYNDSNNGEDEKFKHEMQFQPSRSSSHDLVESLHADHGEKSKDATQRTRKVSLLDMESFKLKRREKYILRRQREVSTAFCPSWVYHAYDSFHLAQRAADRWKQIVKVPSMDALVMKPDLLSFHIASKIPVSESMRQELLEIDGISYRLRREIELLERFDRITCRTCKTLIARRSDMLIMSSEGPLGAYVNPHGYVHEIMTLNKANGLVVIGSPVKEYSWFPGYAWSIAECPACESALGWLFTATKRKLKPRSFWGIRSSQVADDT